MFSALFFMEIKPYNIRFPNISNMFSSFMISFVEISSQDTKCQNTTLKGSCEIKKEISKIYFLATKSETGMWFILLQCSISWLHSALKFQKLKKTKRLQVSLDDRAPCSFCQSHRFPPDVATPQILRQRPTIWPELGAAVPTHLGKLCGESQGFPSKGLFYVFCISNLKCPGWSLVLELKEMPKRALQSIFTQTSMLETITYWHL